VDRFANDLAIYGYTGKVEEFHELLTQTFNKKYRAQYKNVERLLCDPCAALSYAEHVRMLGKFWMPVPELLGCLLKFLQKLRLHGKGLSF